MKNKGFSLVELSVVIVIIAFLLSAVMKGQSMIVESKLQAVVAEVTEHKVAISSFYNKYGKYPGDFNEGLANWGTTTAGFATPNGDYNSHIEFKNGSGVYEGYVAWMHLAYAGMTATPYVGTATTPAAILGTDVPVSKMGGGYLLDYSSSSTAYNHLTANAYGMVSKNIMVLGTPVATSASPILANGMLTPSQAMSLDTKMDDGNPVAGWVRGADGNASTAANCISTAIYKISLSGKDCIMVFKVTD